MSTTDALKAAYDRRLTEYPKTAKHTRNWVYFTCVMLALDIGINAHSLWTISWGLHYSYLAEQSALKQLSDPEEIELAQKVGPAVAADLKKGLEQVITNVRDGRDDLEKAQFRLATGLGFGVFVILGLYLWNGGKLYIDKSKPKLRILNEGNIVDFPDLAAIVVPLCSKLRIGTDQVYVQIITRGAVPRVALSDKKIPSLYVPLSILTRLDSNREEFTAVFAHELAHLANNDLRFWPPSA